MQDEIEEIIKNANELKIKGLTDLEIAEFVHYELAKLFYFDTNCYVGEYDSGSPTYFSKTRKENLLAKSTDLKSRAQTIKGMEQIFAFILNEVEVKSTAIGILKQGYIEPAFGKDITHWVSLFRADDKVYVHDYLMEASLMRCKIGEAETNSEIPGICLEDDYKKRAEVPLEKIELSSEFLSKIFTPSKLETSNEEKMDLIFAKINSYFSNEDLNFNYDEARNLIILSKHFINQEIQEIDLFREDEDRCDVASIFELGKISYIIENKNSEIKYPIGKISKRDIEEILNLDFEGRTEKDREYIERK